eukprot:462402_1
MRCFCSYIFFFQLITVTFGNNHSTDNTAILVSMTSTEIWSFLEHIIVQVVSMKCKTNQNICDKFCSNKQTNGANNHLLLGFASNDDKILFNKYNESDSDNDSEIEDIEDGRTQIVESEITEVTDNEPIDRIFELEMQQTLASALDLLPDFWSIPIGEEQSHTTNIDECLEILKNIDINIDMNTLIINKKNKSDVIHKISEMKQIIEKLQIKIIGDDEGYIESEYDYEYSVDNSDNDEHSIIAIHRNSITLMGDIMETEQ